MGFSQYALALALLAFFSTVVDDFCVLLIFFSTEYGKYPDGLNDPKCQSAFLSVSIGQFVGFTIIVAISLAIGVGLSQTVDEDYIDLIGFIPILIGIYQIYELLVETGYIKPCCCCCTREEKKVEETPNGEEQPLISSSGEGPRKASRGSEGTGDDEKHHSHNKRFVSIFNPLPESEMETDVEAKAEPEPETEPVAGVPAHSRGSSTGDLEALVGDSTWRDADPATRPSAHIKRKLSTELTSRYFESLNEEIDVAEAMLETYTERSKGAKGQVVGSWVMCFMDPIAFEVMIFSLIFGIDNLAIYTVLFANVTDWEIVVCIVVLYVMLFVIIGVTVFILVQCPSVGKFVGENARYFVPFLLIGLGIYILYGSIIWSPGVE